MMMAVAVAAILIATVGVRIRQHWIKCNILVAYYQRLESNQLAMAANLEATVKTGRERHAVVKVFTDAAERRAVIRRKYEHMRWRPWMTIPDVEPSTGPVDSRAFAPPPAPPS